MTDNKRDQGAVVEVYQGLRGPGADSPNSSSPLFSSPTTHVRGDNYILNSSNIVSNSQEYPRIYPANDGGVSPEEWHQDEGVLTRTTCFRMDQYQRYLRQVRSSGIDPRELLTNGIEYSGSNPLTQDFYSLVAVHDRLLGSSRPLLGLIDAKREKILRSVKIGGLSSASTLVTIPSTCCFLPPQRYALPHITIIRG
ncbi:hypothetical protein F4810DRAFT_723595 [Camillea tinctor]|nr:hypothetical protein F4810DRAFT_723595 [Camillea tinctor]